MAWFIIGLLLVVAGIVAAFTAGLFDFPRWIGIVLVLCGLFTVAWDSFTIVPAKNVAVVNTFGRAEDAVDNGFHWVKPWSSIETIDATVQNVNLNADLGQWNNGNCTTIPVRLANQTTACLDLTLQWNIDQKSNANQLWQSYRGTNDDVVGNVGRNVVQRELQRAANKAFQAYDPLAVLGSNGKPVGPSTTDLSATILEDMRRSVDRGIVVDKLLISLVHYDAVTQQKLNGYAQALADTQIAIQQKLTAEQQKEANNLLAAASSNDPGVKYQNCLNLLKDLAAKGQLQNLPQTFNCDGSQTPVILGQR